MSASTIEARALWLATRAAGAVSSRVGGRLAARLWFTPWRVPITAAAAAREAAWLAPTAPLTVPFRDRQLAGFQAGAGPVVLLVHGWADRAARLGALVAPLVGAGYRVVAVDLPAHGDSGDGRTDALEIAAAIRATADHVGAVHGIVAHSLGGLATMLAMRGGLTPAAVTLIAPPVRLNATVARFATLYRLPPRAVSGLRAQIEARFGPSVWDDLSADLIAPRLAVPALIVHDRDDPQVDVADARMLAAAWPRARLLETVGLGHHRVLRDADVIGQITEFMTSADRPAVGRG